MYCTRWILMRWCVREWLWLTERVNRMRLCTDRVHLSSRSETFAQWKAIRTLWLGLMPQVNVYLHDIYTAHSYMFILCYGDFETCLRRNYCNSDPGAGWGFHTFSLLGTSMPVPDLSMDHLGNLITYDFFFSLSVSFLYSVASHLQGES